VPAPPPEPPRAEEKKPEPAKLEVKQEPAVPTPEASKPEASKPEDAEATLESGPSLEERLATAQNASLRARRERIDKRLAEIAEPLGTEALTLPSIHGTKTVDIDRILKKLDRVENDIAEAERLTEPRAEGFFKAIGQDLSKLSEKFFARELRTKQKRLVTELGFALAAVDPKQIARVTEVVQLLERKKDDVRTIGDLFRQARLVDDELDRRAKDGRLHKEPKAIEKLLSKTGEVVGDAGGAAKDKIVDLGKTAAKTAVKQTGKAAWSLAKGAYKISKEGLGGISEGSSEEKSSSDDDDDLDDDEDEAPRRSKKSGKDSEDVTELLKKLARLHKEGVLTDAEFAKKKAELLKRL
jgi:hypothetical protein